jgi:hypothetical protein
MLSCRLRSLAAVAVLSVGLPPSIQTAAAQVRLTGRVVEENSGRPVADARVEVLDIERRTRATARTDAAGAFRVELRDLPGYRIRAVRLGYRTNHTPILWTDGHAEIHVELRLDPEVVLLAPIEVIARSRRMPSPVLESFRARQASGMGVYITRADIELRRPPTVADLLAGIPGVRLESSHGAGFRRTIYLSRALSGPRDCPAQIFVDGFHLNRANPLTGGGFGFAIDDAVSPDAIEGIEVYRGLATIPPEFLTPDSRCGVIAIWTRRGNA